MEGVLKFLAGLFLFFAIFGIYGLIKNARVKSLGRRRAVVHSVKENALRMGEVNLPFVHAVISIPVSSGEVVYKEMTLPVCQPGEPVDIYYNERKDKIYMASTVDSNNPLVAWLFTGLSTLFFVIICLSIKAQSSPDLAAILEEAFVWAVGGIFTIYGIVNSIYVPAKQKRQINDCNMTPGMLVDFKRSHKKGRHIYTPIYQYFNNGEKKFLVSHISGSGLKYKQIGRMVTIAINRINGRIYCVEDEKTSKNIGLILLFAGLTVLCIKIVKTCLGV